MTHYGACINQNYQKTDKIDSRNLCKQLQKNNLRANKILRPYIIESAWIAIRKDPEIQITLFLNNTRAYQTT